MTTIFAGNSPFSTTGQELRQLFGQSGTAQSVEFVTERDTGRSRGCAFNAMPGSEASRAIEAPNGRRMGARPLRVNAAQERTTGGGPHRRP